MCLTDRLSTRDGVLREQAPARRERRRIQPLTWVVAAAVMPVLLYDVWQTVQDVKQRHLVRAAYIAANLESPARPRHP